MSFRTSARSLVRTLLWGAGAITLTLVVAFVAHVVLDQVLAKPGPTSGALEPATVEIARGSGVGAIAKQLESQGVISDPLIFRLGVLRYGASKTLRAGEYEIPPGASTKDVIALLKSGSVKLHRLTLPEGLTTKQILKLVNDDPALSGPLTLTPKEGSLLPDTYFFPKGETRDALVARMAKAQSEFIALHWPERIEGLPLSTSEQAIILASIVEKETGLASERPRVAAVFINRLKKGMRLQADSTIVYGITGGDPIGRAIKRSEIDAQTPYNTYQVQGLPPTPIANPGRESILAVLNAPSTNELFFVADGTGGHVFAETDAEHRRNHVKWRAIRAQKGSGSGSASAKP